MTNTINTEVIPASSAERIVLLDALRGFALLGILLQNSIGQRLTQPVMKSC